MQTIEADTTVKLGGAAMTRPELLDGVMDEVAALSRRSPTVLVHGGGPAVSAMGARLGLKPTFVDGLRVMEAAQMVQVGLISRDLVAALGRRGVPAVGLSGHDLGGWLRASKRAHTDRATGRPVDLGRVGDVTAVDAGALKALMGSGLTPVVAPVAADEALESLNVNADSVAAAVGGALRSRTLVFLTDVEGVRGSDGARVARVDAATLREWIASGVVHGGMIPKVQACLDALEAGVERVIIADGRAPGAVAGALSGQHGTEVVG